jgi:arabinofuranosyltransferase
MPGWARLHPDMNRDGYGRGVTSQIIIDAEMRDGTRHLHARRSDHPWLSWSVVLVPLIIVLAGAWSYRWVQEDAFINFRIIDNLLAGHGPVFNVGERVEGYSDPLWVFSVAGLHEVLSFMTLEWLTVWLGLAGTATGVILAGRATQRLVGRRDEGVTLPVGLLIFSVVAGVWEFATSGLEMGMAFCWVGLSFWLLVRTEERRRSATVCAFIMGLGTLIRPELALMSVVQLAALAVVVSAAGWNGPTGVVRRYLVPLVSAVAAPLLYELWRMAYFALIVSNTALAKSAGGSWWSQGVTYIWNFIAPYTLWLPIALALPLVLVPLLRWWRAGDRTGAVVLLMPIVAAAVDFAYVARVGGDYQHARLLLPGFMSLCVPIYARVRQLRTLMVIPVLGIVAWSVACGGWFRYSTGGIFVTDHGITDERTVWMTLSGSRHPVNASDYHNQLGGFYAKLAAKPRSHDQQVMLVNSLLALPTPGNAANVQPAYSPLPFHLVVNVGAIGVTGLLSGPQIYIFDAYSLTNPIGSHFILVHHSRPGHEKYVSTTWMIGRFGTPATVLPQGVSASSVTAARRALGCGTLNSYLHAITAPLGFSQAISDIAHSFTYTTLTYSAQPRAAEQKLCH